MTGIFFSLLCSLRGRRKKGRGRGEGEGGGGREKGKREGNPQSPSPFSLPPYPLSPTLPLSTPATQANSYVGG